MLAAQERKRIAQTVYVPALVVHCIQLIKDKGHAVNFWSCVWAFERMLLGSPGATEDEGVARTVGARGRHEAQSDGGTRNATFPDGSTPASNSGRLLHISRYCEVKND